MGFFFSATLLCGYGHSKEEFALERLHHDALLLRDGEGTNEMQGIIFARHFMGNRV